MERFSSVYSSNPSSEQCFVGNFIPDFLFSVPCSFHTSFSPYCCRRDFHVLLPCYNLNYKNVRKAIVGQNKRSSPSLLSPKETKSRAKIYNTFESSPISSQCLVSNFLCISVMWGVPLRETKQEQTTYRKKLGAVLMKVWSTGEGMSLGSQTIQFLCSLKLYLIAVPGSLKVCLPLQVFCWCTLLH